MAPVAGTRMKWVALAVMVVGAVAAMGAMRGCEEKTAAGVAPVKIGSKQFYLEVVADDDKRFKGLSDRTSIEEDGGMLFVFPQSKVRVQEFVMRDCPIPIDIIYCDGSGRIIAMHNMVPEDKRGSQPKDEEISPKSGLKYYEERLKRYSSRFPSQIVIELKGGTIQKVGVKEGDQVVLKADELKKLAK